MSNNHEWCPENDLVGQMEQAEQYSGSMFEENKKLRALIAEVKAQRDELKAALELICSMDYKNAATNCFAAKAVDIANKALTK